MTAEISFIDYLGEKAVLARTDRLEMILVPSWGSNAVSLRYLPKDMEILRSPTSAEAYHRSPALFGIPVLFPPNRIADGTFRYRDRTYHFEINEEALHNHLHGFVVDRAWQLKETREEENRLVLETEFDSADYPEVMKQFPHHFVLHLTYILEGEELRQELTVENAGEETFPWGIGYHTTFLYPLAKGGDLAKCSFSLTAEKQWELTPRFVPNGTLSDIPYREKLAEGMDLTGCQLDDAFMSSASATGANETVLSDPEAGLSILYQADHSFKHWVVYNNDGKQGFLCPEPYTWITNAPNLRGQVADEITGFQELGPKAKAQVSTVLKVREI